MDKAVTSAEDSLVMQIQCPLKLPAAAHVFYGSVNQLSGHQVTGLEGKIQFGVRDLHLHQVVKVNLLDSLDDPTPDLLRNFLEEGI